MKKYGLTSIDLKNAQYKIDRQKEYLLNNEFITSNGQVKNFLDVSFSANLSERYYAQLANKTNTIENIAFNDSLDPIFLTITLDGFFRDLLRADYTRLDKFFEDDQKKKQILKSIPNNDTRGYLHQKIKNKEIFTITDLYNVLNHQFENFKKSYVFKKIKKDGSLYHYIKTTEPHNDGVPHFHIMFFIDKKYNDSFISNFLRHCPAPRNKKGIELNVNNASAYILKYITKSFMDIKNQKELDYLQAWYIKHKIQRCVTSRSLVPQWVMRKLIVLEKDWYYLTDLVKADRAEYDWCKESDIIYIKDPFIDREFIYTCGLSQMYSKGIKIAEHGNYVKKIKYNIYEKTPTKWTNKKKPVPIYTYGKLTHHIVNDKIIKYTKHISNMNNYELIQYFQDYDLENESYIYYLATRNLLIDRGLLSEEKYNLDNFDINDFLFSS